MSRIVSGAGSVLDTLSVAPAVQALSPSCPAYLNELDSRLANLVGFAVVETAGTGRSCPGRTGSGVRASPGSAGLAVSRGTPVLAASRVL